MLIYLASWYLLSFFSSHVFILGMREYLKLNRHNTRVFDPTFLIFILLL